MEATPQDDELFIKVSDIEIEQGQVTIRNPELAAVLEEFAAKDPEVRESVAGKFVVAW